MGTQTARERRPALALDGVSFGYQATAVLAEVTLQVREGEFVCLLGPSGSGKSTVLRLLAGLERPQRGSILVGGLPVVGPGIDRGVVFQDYSLFPWMSLTENIVLAIGKAHPALTREQRHELAEEYLDLVGLAEARTKYPGELSGGMCQRGAIARALAMGAPVLLMDEPFGALDPVNRTRLQDLLLEVWNSSQPARTIVFVTHDVDEALLLADRVVVLGACPGRVIADLEVPIPRPRPRRQTYARGEFQALRKTVNELLEGDVLRRLFDAETVGEGAGI